MWHWKQEVLLLTKVDNYFLIKIGFNLSITCPCFSEEFSDEEIKQKIAHSTLYDLLIIFHGKKKEKIFWKLDKYIREWKVTLWWDLASLYVVWYCE